MNDSPAKKISFKPEDKENLPADAQPPATDSSDLSKPITEIVKTAPEVKVAPTIKGSEADEPLLQENPQRFVLFPIKYHEVRVNNNASRV